MAIVIWSKRSYENLAEIDGYLAERSPQAASRVVQGLLRVADLLSLQPRIGARVAEIPEREVRATSYGSYRVFHEIESDEVVHILSIVHGARDTDEMKF